MSRENVRLRSRLDCRFPRWNVRACIKQMSAKTMGKNIVASGTVSVSSGCGVMEQWVGVGCTIMPAVT